MVDDHSPRPATGTDPCSDPRAADAISASGPTAGEWSRPATVRKPKSPSRQGGLGLPDRSEASTPQPVLVEAHVAMAPTSRRPRARRRRGDLDRVSPEIREFVALDARLRCPRVRDPGSGPPSIDEIPPIPRFRRQHSAVDLLPRLRCCRSRFPVASVGAGIDRNRRPGRTADLPQTVDEPGPRAVPGP